ncbi:hypothetical protein ACOSP7_028372 [Xanthoceras sorbifolium]
MVVLWQICCFCFVFRLKLIKFVSLIIERYMCVLRIILVHVMFENQIVKVLYFHHFHITLFFLALELFCVSHCVVSEWHVVGYFLDLVLTSQIRLNPTNVHLFLTQYDTDLGYDVDLVKKAKIGCLI